MPSFVLGEKGADIYSDVWTSDDEKSCNGNLEDEYPDGFTWNCCDGGIKEEGWRVGPHVVRSEAVTQRLFVAPRRFQEDRTPFM